MSTYEINKEFESDIFNLLEQITKYFENDNIKQYKENVIIEDREIDDNLKAKQLLDRWIKDNRPFEYILKRYKKFEFHGGGRRRIKF